MAELALSSPTVMHRSVDFARNRTVRRILKCWWHEEKRWARWVAWLMLNPSNADGTKDDPTTGRLTEFTMSWGYTGWIAINIYPFVSSKPAEMWKRANWLANGPDWYARDDMAANLADIESVGRSVHLRMVAFGAEPIKHDPAWLEKCLEAYQQPSVVEEYTGGLHCLGVNMAGQPLHPLARGKWRVPKGAQPQPWEPSRG